MLSQLLTRREVGSGGYIGEAGTLNQSHLRNIHMLRRDLNSVPYTGATKAKEKAPET